MHEKNLKVTRWPMHGCTLVVLVLCQSLPKVSDTAHQRTRRQLMHAYATRSNCRIKKCQYLRRAFTTKTRSLKENTSVQFIRSLFFHFAQYPKSAYGNIVLDWGRSLVTGRFFTASSQRVIKVMTDCIITYLDVCLLCAFLVDAFTRGTEEEALDFLEVVVCDEDWRVLAFESILAGGVLPSSLERIKNEKDTNKYLCTVFPQL